MVNIVEIDSIIKLKDKNRLLSVEEIAKKETNRWRPSRYFGQALFQYPDYQEYAEKYFKNKIVVDIGCGVDISLFRVCCIVGAKGYIGVDYENDYDANLMSNLHSKEYWEKHDNYFKKSRLDHPRDVPVGLAYEKAQDFLKRLPDNSVSVYAGGLDTCIIPGENETREIETEVIRVLDPKGAFISNCSRLFRKVFDYIPKDELNLVKEFNDRYPNMDVRIK